MNTKTCPKCGACWINDQHYWSGTSKLGDESELASLVCDKFNYDECINPVKGTTKGNGWEVRLNNLNNLENDMKRMYE